jgi:hypothetical protein
MFVRHNRSAGKLPGIAQNCKFNKNITAKHPQAAGGPGPETEMAAPLPGAYPM